jgi:hypothetical protein
MLALRGLWSENGGGVGDKEEAIGSGHNDRADLRGQQKVGVQVTYEGRGTGLNWCSASRSSCQARGG